MVRVSISMFNREKRVWQILSVAGSEQLCLLPLHENLIHWFVKKYDWKAFSPQEENQKIHRSTKNYGVKKPSKWQPFERCISLQIWITSLCNSVYDFPIRSYVLTYQCIILISQRCSIVFLKTHPHSMSGFWSASVVFSILYIWYQWPYSSKYFYNIVLRKFHFISLLLLYFPSCRSISNSAL